jgi:hypothetical protein
MKRAKNDCEVTAPNGETFVVGWAMPTHVARTFGGGRWGIAVMRRNGSVVEIRQVNGEGEGEAAIRDLAAAILAGRWQPPVGGVSNVSGARHVTEIPRRAVPIFVFVCGSAGLLLSGAGVGFAVVTGAILAAVVTACLRWGL